MRVRKLLLPLIAVTAGVLVSGGVAFLAQDKSREVAVPAYVVVPLDEMSLTPRSIPVVMRRGADRVQQRSGSSPFGPCRRSGMGCPSSSDLVPVTVFLLLDDTGQPRAFIGEDPRNGCALEWVPGRAEQQQRAVFHDVCHGSTYDRQGHLVWGPSPWNLNGLAIEVRDGKAYIDPRVIVTGDCPGCHR